MNERVENGSVICDNCNWEWTIDTGGDDVYLCHKCNHDNTPISKNDGGGTNLMKEMIRKRLRNI